MAIKSIIFDMDGVLINSEPLHMEVERKIYKELKLPVSKEEHLSFVGMVPLQIWSILRDRYDLKRNPAQLKQQEQERKYELFLRRDIPLVPGVRQLLQDFSEDGYTLGLASSSPRQIIELFTEKTETQRYFKFLLSGEEVPQGKPAPDIFLAAAKRLNRTPNECAVIEDSANGVRAAKAAGMICIGFQNPDSGHQDLQPADLIIKSFEGEGRVQIEQLLGRR